MIECLACLALVVVFYDTTSLYIGHKQACCASSKDSYSACKYCLHAMQLCMSYVFA